MGPVHVCFVCSGNICRSPMAALVFTEHLRREGLADQVRVSSCGTGPWHVGEGADPRTEKVLADHGYPIEHVAAELDADHLSADLLVAMDSGHRRVLERAGARGEIRMLRSFDPDSDDRDEVPDPYFDAERGFEIVMGMVEAAVPGMLERVRENS
jgi:protein-tyrosine phosphatase